MKEMEEFITTFILKGLGLPALQSE
jgi:hypothetical protein